MELVVLQGRKIRWKKRTQHFKECSQASQVALVIKNLPANTGEVRDGGSNPGLGRNPWSRAWQPTPVLVPGESHGQRSLAGNSPEAPLERVKHK